MWYNRLNMKFIHEDLAKAAAAAIEMEEEGYSIYIKAAERASNPLGASTLRAIAEKELLHKKTIEDFYAGLTGGKRYTASFAEGELWSSKLRSEILRNIKDSLDKLSGNDQDLIRVYEISMDMEKQGHNFYRNISANTDNEDAKKLFDFLAREENEHYEILQDTHLYLSSPSEWFKKEEKWLVEG